MCLKDKALLQEQDDTAISKRRLTEGRWVPTLLLRVFHNCESLLDKSLLNASRIPTRGQDKVGPLIFQHYHLGVSLVLRPDQPLNRGVSLSGGSAWAGDTGLQPAESTSTRKHSSPPPRVEASHENLSPLLRGEPEQGSAWAGDTGLDVPAPHGNSTLSSPGYSHENHLLKINSVLSTKPPNQVSVISPHPSVFPQ